MQLFGSFKSVPRSPLSLEILFPPPSYLTEITNQGLRLCTHKHSPEQGYIYHASSTIPSPSLLAVFLCVIIIAFGREAISLNL